MAQPLTLQAEPLRRPAPESRARASLWSGARVTPGLALISAGITLALLLAAVRAFGAAALLGEGGTIELLQLVSLGACALAQLRFARRPDRRSAPLLLAGLFTLMLIRELDGLLDRLWHGSWKVPAAALGLACVRAGWRRRHALALEWPALVASRAFGLLTAALFVLLVQSRLIGQQVVWRAVLGEHFTSHVPRLIEELSELCGYGLLLVASLDAASTRRPSSPSRTNSQQDFKR